MSKFKIKKIPQVKGKVNYYKLVKDDHCEFDEFCDKIEKEGNYFSELKTLFSYMDFASNLQPLPKNKFNDITPKKEKVKEQEFKSKHLRIYAIQLKGTGKIIICGGTKNTQDDDIRHFRNIKHEFLNSLK